MTTETEVISLPLDTNQFEANGKTYTFQESLSTERYRMFEQLRLEAGFGMSVAELAGVLDQNINFVERFAQGEKVFSDMAVLNYNARKGIANLTQKEPYAMWLCTLFFNTPEENKRVFDTEVMKGKLKDWDTAGIDSFFFINRACALIVGFNRLYSAITRQSSDPTPNNPEPEAGDQTPKPTD